MKRTFASIALLVLGSVAALAQAGSTAPAPATSAAQPPLPSGNKVAVIAMQDAIAGSNEGQRDLEALAKKFEPRRLELQKLNTDIEEQKKQLTNAGDKMSPEAHEALVKSIETKTKTLQRSAEDAQNEFQQQQNEIAGRIMQKLAPVVMKYLADNGYGLLLDNSSPWPQGPVVFGGPSFDITKAVVDAYNVQSGVPAPARTGGATGAAKPAGTGTTPVRPATTAPKPATTTPPKQ
jgi:outer membrane protein